MPGQLLLEHNKENTFPPPPQMYTIMIGEGFLLLEIFCQELFFSSRKKENWGKKTKNPQKLSLNKLHSKRSSDDLSEIEIIHFQLKLPIAMKLKIL